MEMEIILKGTGKRWYWRLMKGEKPIARSFGTFTRRASAKRNAAAFLKNMVYSSTITIAD
ncbi:MAG TPA: hypothetical protein ENI27_02280 [bacterium]|nr:hypothetical protein [bacterium]